MKKALIVSTTLSVVKLFNMENIKILISLGYEVHVATNFNDISYFTENEEAEFLEFVEINNIVIHNIDFKRNFICLNNHFKAFNQLRKLKKIGFSLIHTHTPIASFIVRFAFRKSDAKIIYTAHGFHFYKGAPFVNWAIFYPMEKLASRYTDTLITINKDDYNLALAKFSKCKVEYIPGIGIDVVRYNKYPMEMPSVNIELKKGDTILISIGELNENKNHIIVIEAMRILKNPNIKYLIAGKGKLEGFLNKKIKEYNLDNQVVLLGFVQDVEKYYNNCNIFVFPSYREGLPVSLMEAMACYMPALVSTSRGCRDLIDNGKGGFQFNPNDAEELSGKINNLMFDDKKSKDFGLYNRNKVEKYSTEIINTLMERIYRGVKKL